MPETWLRIIAEDLGPFGHVELSLTPITVVFGRNSLGKSFLLYLLWALADTPPDLYVLGKEMGEAGAFELAEECAEKIADGGDATEEFRKLVEMALDLSLIHI